MKRFGALTGILSCAVFAAGLALVSTPVFAVSVGGTATAGTAAAASGTAAATGAPGRAAFGATNNNNNFAYSGANTNAGGGRGYAQLANAYQQNQRNTYYMVTQPDVDSACRDKIFQCLSNYCGSITVVPGQRENRCNYASETELYNYALLCLQADNEALLPQFSTSNKTSAKGMNTAARLCPSYVQQELMTFMSMMNMSDQLTKSRSSVCISRRQELEAAMSCHDVAISYGNATASMLQSQLTDFCGAGVPGGSAEMVAKFANAGNVGADIWGWAEKVVSLDLSQKGKDWQTAVDAVLASYTNRMNLACGDDMQINIVASGGGGDNQPTNLQVAAALALNTMFPAPAVDQTIPAAIQNQALYLEIKSMTEVFDFATAQQVVNAGLTNQPTVQNPYLSSATMGAMQKAYNFGTKVFVLRDSARCYIVPVSALNNKEQGVLAQTLAGCVSN